MPAVDRVCCLCCSLSHHVLLCRVVCVVFLFMRLYVCIVVRCMVVRVSLYVVWILMFVVCCVFRLCFCLQCLLFVGFGVVCVLSSVVD